MMALYSIPSCKREKEKKKWANTRFYKSSKILKFILFSSIFFQQKLKTYLYSVNNILLQKSKLYFQKLLRVLIANRSLIQYLCITA